MAQYIASQHTSDCQENHNFIVTVQAEMDAYKHTWPKHCATCLGAGVIWDNGDPSVGMYGWWDACPDCVQQGICPRCGEPHGHNIDEDTNLLDQDGKYACVACGGVLGQDRESLAALHDQIAFLPDCLCGEPWQ